MVKKVIILLLLSVKLFSQSALLDDIKQMDVLRKKQLLGDTSLSDYSFMSRSTSGFQNMVFSKLNAKHNISISNLVFAYTKQTNDQLPYGANEGNMYPALGLQERYTIGANIKWGILDVNIQPEWVNAENKAQAPFLGNVNDGNWWTRYFFHIANNIDDYRQMGNTPIQHFDWGQSRVGIATKYIMAGVSNENIWWGPGRNNSIALTNNAPGFKHAYFGTNQPLRTQIGSFELNSIIGQLDTLTFIDPDVPKMKSIWAGAIAPKQNRARTISGITANWQPKWVPNFFIGYTYTQQFYSRDSNSNGIPYTFFSKERPKTVIGVLNFRMLFPKDHAEIYAEIGNPQAAPWPWKYFQSNANTGFVVGARKLFTLKKLNSYLEFFGEFTQLQLMDPRQVFVPGDPFGVPQITSWYTSNVIRQGYTNQAKLLGASIGPGSNSQYIGISWNKGMNKIGYSLERVVHNNDFYEYVNLSHVGSGKANGYWVDMNSCFEIQINPIKNILIGYSLIQTQDMNYRWVRVEDGSDWSDGSKISDHKNLQMNLTIKYLLHGNR